MHRVLALFVLSACGRLGFDASSDAPVDTSSDADRSLEQPGEWRTTTPLPNPRRLGCGFGFAGRVYSIGGIGNGIVLDDVVSAHVGSFGLLDAWEFHAPLPQPTWWHACTVDPATRSIYVIGGDDNDVTLTTVYRATIAADGSISAWATDRAIPDGRRGHGAYVAQGSLCVAGGERALGFIVQDTVFCAAIAGDGSLGAWTSAPPLPIGDYMFGTTVVDNTVFLTGGYIANTGVLAGAPASALSSTTPLPSPRQRHAAIAAAGYLYVAGGEDFFDSPNLATVVRARITGATLAAWETVAQLPLAIAYATGAAVDDRVYIISGSNDVDPVANVYVLTP